MNKKLILIVLAALMPVLLCGSAVRADDSETAMKKYVYKDKGITISFPADWGVVPGKGGTAVIAIDPSAGSDNPMPTSVSLVVKTNKENYTLDNFDKEIMEKDKSRQPGYSREGSGETVLGGSAGRWFIYTFPAEGGIKGKAMGFITMNGDKIYMLVGMTWEKDFKKFRPLFEKIAESLSFN